VPQDIFGDLGNTLGGAVAAAGGIIAGAMSVTGGLGAVSEATPEFPEILDAGLLLLRRRLQQASPPAGAYLIQVD